MSGLPIGLADIRFRHTAERLKKSENVIEKYKKKLEDTAELRRELKVRQSSLTLLIIRVRKSTMHG